MNNSSLYLYRTFAHFTMLSKFKIRRKVQNIPLIEKCFYLLALFFKVFREIIFAFFSILKALDLLPQNTVFEYSNDIQH